MSGVDFTAWFHPVAAVACPTCGAGLGRRCMRPSGHAAAQFHSARCEAADTLFIEIHGEKAWIERLAGGGWRVHARGYSGDQKEPPTRAPRQGERRAEAPAQLSMGF